MSILPETRTGTWRRWQPPSPAHLQKGPDKDTFKSMGWPLGKRDRGKDPTSWGELDRFALFVGAVWAKPQAAGSEHLSL